MNTAACKSFIEKTLLDPTNKDINEELTTYHDASGVSTNLWSRASKSKIKDQSDYDWAVERFKESLSGFPDESCWIDKSYHHLNFAGCTVREFLHKEADCIFGIFTDTSDAKVIAWFFQVD